MALSNYHLKERHRIPYDMAEIRDNPNSKVYCLGADKSLIDLLELNISDYTNIINCFDGRFTELTSTTLTILFLELEFVR